jgi:hypothetical protein
MALDSNLAAVLGIQPPKSNPLPKLVAAARDQTKANQARGSINAVYETMRLPAVSKSDNAQAIVFHRAAQVAIAEECRGAVEALNKIDQDLMPPVRLAKAAGIARMAIQALHARIANAAVPLARIVYEARQIVDRVMNPEPSDPTAALSWRMRVEGLRRQLDEANPQGQIAALTKLAQAGDPAFPELALNSVADYLPSGLAVNLTSTYQAAAAGPAAATLDAAEDALAEVKAVLGCAELALGATFNNAGVPSTWKNVPTPDIIRSWSKAAKANFLSAVGTEAYEDLLQGRLSLEDSGALSIFRPGLSSEGM